MAQTPIGSKINAPSLTRVLQPECCHANFLKALHTLRINITIRKEAHSNSSAGPAFDLPFDYWGQVI